MPKPTSKPNKKIYLVFTRDFDQWVQEMARNSLVLDAPKIWGRGISDQIVRFTGRTFEWYRYRSDMDSLKQFLINKPTAANIFQKMTHAEFFNSVKAIRKLIKLSPKKIQSPAEHLEKLTFLFRKMYPFYPLGIFIAGPWREDFLKIHGKNGGKILKLLFHSREQSEGLLKEVGNYLRKWLSPLLENHKYPASFIRLLSVAEIKSLINLDSLPPRSELEKRNRGYVYFKGKIFKETHFANFLKKTGTELEPPQKNDNGNTLKGNAAYIGKKVSGKAQIILNSFEANKFQKGSVLITPMTSPEYLPAIRIARAIVTDEGGLTCHAAITAREIKKPCLIGTKNATQFFKDGDMVEVDTSKGLIKKLK